MFAFALFVAAVVGANLAVEAIGIVPVGFGLMAPAAVYFVGLALVARDFVQERYGPVGSLAAVAVGGVLSLAVAPSFALASTVAFLLSEVADLAVYTPLRRRGLTRAVLASNAVGAVVDSVVFLGLAFGSLAFLRGQVLGKVWATLAALAVLHVIAAVRRK